MHTPDYQLGDACDSVSEQFKSSMTGLQLVLLNGIHAPLVDKFATLTRQSKRVPLEQLPVHKLTI